MIYYIYGTDPYLVSQKIEEVKRGFQEKRDKSGLNVIRLDAEGLDFDRLSQEALTVPFLSEKKLIIVSGLCASSPAGRKALRDEIAAFLKSHKDLDNNILFADVFKDEKDSLPKKDELFIFLSKLEYKWHLPTPKGRQIAEWLKKYCAANKISVDPAAATELAFLSGGDLLRMTNELKKLSAYKAGGMILIDDVRLMVGSAYDEAVFGLTDALAAKDRPQALKLLARQLLGDNAPLALVGSINFQFKSMLKIRSLLDSDPRLTAATIQKKFGLHPYVASKNLFAVKKFTSEELTNILNDLFGIEKQLKSGDKNPELLLDMFIAKHC